MDQESWFLHKVSVNEIYGPASLSTLQAWSAAAKINPMDRVSSDNKQTWLRAPMIPELQMDWLIELEDDRLYGPTNLGTIQDFLNSGEINEDTTVINCLEARTVRIGEIAYLKNTARRTPREDLSNIGNTGSLADSLDARVRSLEERVRKLEAAAIRSGGV